MKKFWMVMLAIVACLSAGLQTGCPDGDDDCASDPSLCDPDSDTDSDAGADADADADNDVVEDDAGTTPETDNDADVDADIDGSTTTCDGGWLDPATALCWQNPSLASGPRNPLSWDEAVAYCNSLHESGSWRLPTINELRSLVHGCPETETGGACGMTNACLSLDCMNIACSGCPELYTPPTYCPAVLDGPHFAYWSSSHMDDGINTLYLDCSRGSVWGRSGVYNELDVRCVR